MTKELPRNINVQIILIKLFENDITKIHKYVYRTIRYEIVLSARLIAKISPDLKL